MKKLFVIGWISIIGNFVLGQEVVDTLTYYTISIAKSANPDTIYGLNLSKNKLSKDFSEELLQYKNLKGLKLSKNRLKDLPINLKELEGIEFLYLNNNKFTSFPAVLFHFKQLKYIDFSHNQIEEIPDDISDLKNLEYIDMWNNPLVEISDSFSELKQLKYADFRGVTYGFSFVEKWTEAFPQTVIKFSPPCDCKD